MFLKTVFYSKKTKSIRKIGRTYLVSIFFFFCSENTMNIENIKFREQKQFSDNIKMILSVFSKFLLNNNFKKHEPNTPTIMFSIKLLMHMKILW